MMLFVLFIILVLAYFTMMLIPFISGMTSDNCNEPAYWSATLAVGIISGVAAVFLLIDSRIPTAMDVYKGKTAIEVTYRNGVPVDSTVVFKDKK